MPNRTGDPQRRADLEANADLGLPVPYGAPHRLVKRIVARLCWPLLRHQVEFNRDLLAVLLEQGGTVEHHGHAIFAVREVLEDVQLDRSLLREEVELAHQQSFARFHDGVGAIRTEMGELAQRYELARSELATTDARLGELRQELERRLADVRMRLSQVDVVLDVVRRSLPQPPPLAELAGTPGAFENLYGPFEEALRGPYETVKERAREYLADVRAIASDAPVLDVGCGRGEWLDVLGEAGVPAYGIEVSARSVEVGRKNGLDMRLANAREHLLGLEERSLRAITAIHVAEHLGTDDLIEFLDLAVRAIEPGGLLVLETPNPENLIVGASSFYLDPTHRNPLPPALLAFLVEARGFADVEVRLLARKELRPMPSLGVGEPWAEDLRQIVDLLNGRLFNAQDYAIVARRR
ncbi:MAG TPA: class I SAM-dependent methyltransferase [Acidimicrobiales bacterium]|nr:class I SAM-dependent methyltransferase [Acidimicrobiales bacterium]